MLIMAVRALEYVLRSQRLCNTKEWEGFGTDSPYYYICGRYGPLLVSPNFLIMEKLRAMNGKGDRWNQSETHNVTIYMYIKGIIQ
jgi:hypothetical protein